MEVLNLDEEYIPEVEDAKAIKAERARIYYIKNRDRIVAKTTKYVKDNPDKRKKYVHNYYQKHYSSLYNQLLERMEANPERYRAYLKVKRAINSGKLHKEPCEICGSAINVQSHHHNGYNDPFDIIWLCVPHHTIVHNISRATNGL